VTPELTAALRAALGSEVRESATCAGGDINDAYRVQLQDGRRVFVKTRECAPSRFFVSEADGLRWLAEAGALRIPEVLAECDTPRTSFLALEWIERAPRGGQVPGSQAADPHERLGRGLALLHQSGSESFGFQHDGFIGPLPQRNRSVSTWAEFYGEQRLEPLARLARDRGCIDGSLARMLASLCERLDALVGPSESPARLHGDLWSGNVLYDAKGEVWLIDPAAYAGHREVDLAMLALFGGLDRRVLDAYEEVSPLADGHSERVRLYQIYPLLVHVLLFGGGYGAQLREAVAFYEARRTR